MFKISGSSAIRTLARTSFNSSCALHLRSQHIPRAQHHLKCGCPSCTRSVQTRFFHKHQPLHAKKETDPYKILGVPKSATKDDIKKKFKEQAKKYHPDVNKAPDAATKFAEMNSAYQILVDDNKRNIYDQTGSAEAADGNMGGGPGDYGPFGQGMNQEQAQEIFEQFFGKGGPFGGGFDGGNPFSGFDQEQNAQPSPKHGSDRREVLHVSLKEAVYGATKDLKVTKYEKCTPCSGSGKDQKRSATKCEACNGKGRKETRQGFFAFQQDCRKCSGTGKVNHSCSSCSGTGTQKSNKTIELSVGPAAEHGSLLRVRNYGNPGAHGGTTGDMFVEIVVDNDPVYKRVGLDIEMDAKIPMTTAVLGGVAHVKTLKNEDVQVNVPAGIQYNEKVVVSGKGVPAKKGSTKTGNLNVHFQISVPKSISAEQRRLMEEFKAAGAN